MDNQFSAGASESKPRSGDTKFPTTQFEFRMESVWTANSRPGLANRSREVGTQHFPQHNWSLERVSMDRQSSAGVSESKLRSWDTKLSTAQVQCRIRSTWTTNIRLGPANRCREVRDTKFPTAQFQFRIKSVWTANLRQGPANRGREVRDTTFPTEQFQFRTRSVWTPGLEE